MMESRTFSLITLGCKVNQYESQRIREELYRCGFVEVSPESPSDIAMVNTCTVTHIADRKSRQKVRQALRSAGIVMALGCAVENGEEAFRKISERIILVPNTQKKRFMDFIPSMTSPCGKRTEPGDFSRTRALLKIQDGCDHFCSYCIVPHVRGRSRSRDRDSIREEALSLMREGYREIVITGIHLGAYGLDTEGRRTLDGLLAELAPLLAGVRIRLSSVEPADFSPGLLDVLSAHGNICPHIHLPLQHASQRILDRMNRGYGIEKYSSIVESLMSSIADMAITTDIITGFPGEEEEDFQRLMEYVAQTPFYRLHVFKYSPRKGTPAASWHDHIDERVKQQRSALLIEEGLRKTRAFLNGFRGRVMPVLVEGCEGGLLHGLTPDYIKVCFEGLEALCGTVVNVRMEEREDTAMKGTLI